MTDKIKRGLAVLAGLTALALGGAAIAGATGENSSSPGSPTTEMEQGEDGEGSEQGEESEDGEGSEQGEDGEAGEEAGGDGDEQVSSSVDQRARAAAEQATGGQADGDVEPAEKPDPVEDRGDAPIPSGAVYEVEVTKGGQALKVFLDSSFEVLDTVPDAE